MTPKFIKFGDMTIGEVPLALLRRRRNNYRKMASAEFAALQASVAKHGFQSLIVVEESKTEPGCFDVIDGHHRWEALEKLGRLTAPVVVIGGLSKGEADLAMMTFNVSAEILPDEFYALVRDVQAQLGETELATFTGLNEDFLRSLNVEIAKIDVATQEPPAAATPPKGRGTVAANTALLSARNKELCALAAQALGNEAFERRLEATLKSWLTEVVDT